MAPIPPSNGRADLAADQADAFLNYLFSTVARRPKLLSLREGASVARYLKALTLEMEAGEVRKQLDRLADAIWAMLFQFAPIQASDKPTVIGFLDKHRSTYLAGLDRMFGLENAFQQIRKAPVPSRGDRFPAPLLQSGHQSVYGPGRLHLDDDLTERVYAGYHALRRAGVRNARGRIATVLNRHQLRTRAGGLTSTKWGSDEVYERVKQYDARLKKQAGTAEPWDSRAGFVVAKWVSSYSTHGRSPGTQRLPESPAPGKA